MRKSDKGVDEFLGDIEEPAKSEMARMDELISGALSGWSRDLWVGKFWGGTDHAIIGYGDYNYEKRGGARVEWFVVGLA